MYQIHIVGGNPLEGEITISGAKNSSLPLLSACLLAPSKVKLSNIPLVEDIKTMLNLLSEMGVDVIQNKSDLELDASNLKSYTASYELVSKMRASILVLGPLLTRLGKAEVALPGGCAIGTRPVDIHINGLIKMGAEIEIDKGYIKAKAKNGLIGTEFSMPIVSVTATKNLMMAATLAKGTTVLLNCAKEPEVTDLAEFLNKMGAKVYGYGTGEITIEGVESLYSANHEVMADRIETGTYAIAALATKGKLNLKNTSINLIPTLDQILIKAGGKIIAHKDGFSIEMQSSEIEGVDMITSPFPALATDLQAQTMALMSICKGASMITETIFENRFMHVQELCRMGANINVHGSSALIRGVPFLNAAPVQASDLRASAGLIIAGLVAKGETTIRGVHHLDRGYEKIEEKLAKCGVKIYRQKVS